MNPMTETEISSIFIFEPNQVSIQSGHWWDLHQRLCVCV